MYYLGQFSFLEEHENEDRYYGFFNCMVEADSPDKAVGLFGSHIRKSRKSYGLFHGITNIFLNHIIEVEQLPKSGIMTNYISIYGEMPPMLRCGLPKKMSGVHCYGLTADEAPKESANESMAEPFLIFEGHAG